MATAAYSRIAETSKEDRGSTVNNSPSSSHTSDPVTCKNGTSRPGNTDARGAQFNNVGRDQINYHGTTVSILETLGKYNVPGAMYDSSQREYAPSCLPNTRLDVMGKIWEWVSGDDDRPIFLLTGLAGSGKSTIAQTFAKDCADENKLAASFFCSKGSAQCSSISRIILTLAYQLAISVPSAQGLIQEALQADPSIPDKNLAVQFTKLVYRPILALKHLISPMIVIIDALDECEDKGGVAKLIEIITGAFREGHTHFLRFFFTSRAEDYIAVSFAAPQTKQKTSHLVLEDFKWFDENEDEEITRLNPDDLVQTWVRDNASARRWILHLIELGSSSLNNPVGLGTGGVANQIFAFPFTLSGGWGNDRKVTSFVDHPLQMNLDKPFTISAWVTSSDSLDWRTILSFESPLCHSSLFNIALMPSSQVVYFAYMRNAQQRVDIKTEALAPASAWFHFAFVLLDSYRLAIYINGIKVVSGSIDGPIFNPKRVVIGRTKFNGNFTAQWNGKIQKVKIFDRAFSDGEITVESKWTD